MEGLSSQYSLEQFYAELSTDQERAFHKTARDVTAALAERFRFRDAVRDVHNAVEQALVALRKIDMAWDSAPEGACLRVFRRKWFEAAPLVEHVRRVGFFSTHPVDLLPWVRWFLLVENYHRTDPVHHDRRLDRLRFLKTENPHAPCISHEDVLLWLEHQLLVHEREPLSAIAEKCAEQLRNRLDETLRPHTALDAFFFVLLRCHQFCLAETMTEDDARRLQTVLGWRRFLSLTDLMLVVIHRVLDREPLPDAVTVLDELMADGFQIRHASFKDPYEADVVAAEDTARFDETTIRLFASVDKLHGILERDCAAVFQEWQARRGKVLDELEEEICELREMIANPLPRKHLIGRTIRLLTSWCLAHGKPGDEAWENMSSEEGLRALVDRVRASFPEGVLKALVRQRRGYELTTRKELALRIERECRLQWESFRKEPGSRAYGEVDFRIAERVRALASGPVPPEKGDADALKVETLAGLADLIRRRKISDEAVSSSLCLGLDVFFPTMGTPLEFVESLRDLVPYEELCNRAPSAQKGGPEEAVALYERTLARFAGAFYRFVVAQGKKEAGLPLELSLSEIPELAAVMVPPWGALTEGLLRSAVRKFQHQSAPLYRRRKNPICLDEEEFGVHLAHFVMCELKADVKHSAETGTLAAVRKAVTEEALRVVVPDRVRTLTSPERFLLQWAGILDSRQGAEELQRAVAGALPGLDCGACGESRCASFAQGLLQGRRRIRECVHLSPAGQRHIEAMVQEHLSKVSRGNGVGSAYELFRNPALWRRLPKADPLRRSVVKVVDVGRQEERRRVMDHAFRSWQGLDSKPDVYKRPDPEAFYQALVETIGYEATERIRPEERRWLAEHGRIRLEKELEKLEKRTDWLTLERLLISGGPSSLEADPETQALRAYEAMAYLHQLHEDDRRRLLVHRLESFEEGFSQWWNQDLLTMNHPRYRIDNWEEFSKVIKNAFWHQENFPPPRRVAEELLEHMEQSGEKEVFFRDVLSSWVQDFRGAGDLFPQGRRDEAGTDRREIENLSDLRRILARLCRDTRPAAEKADFSASVPGSTRRRIDAVWKAFQKSPVTFAATFSLSDGDFTDLEKQHVRDRLGGQLPADLSLVPSMAGGLEALVLGLIGALLEQQDHQRRLAALTEEAVRCEQAEKLPQEAVRAWIFEALEAGHEPRQILEKVLGWFHQFPLWKDRILVDALQKMVSLTRWRNLLETFPGVVLEGIPAEVRESYARTFSRWMERVAEAVGRLGDFDRERLLYYLFVLAKREGDLDVITALLREIRETSDVIEAAWLQFTNDRLTEVLPAPPTKGLEARYSLLINRLKDLEPVCRGLMQGLSRSEKPDVAAAVRELQLYMRFHMVRDEAEAMDADACFETFWEEGYNLEGLDKETLRQAFLAEWKNRERWRKDRVWLMTMAVARRLASQSHELYEADKAFAKMRQGLLKEDGPEEGRDVCRRRGIALGTVKEAMYRELSELLERERMDSFRTRIRQIVHQLDRKRLRIVQAWFSGSIDRYSVFHVLRQYQKRAEPPSDDDFREFFMEQWFRRVDRLRESDRADRDDRIREVDEGFHALLGVSPLALEKEAAKEAAEAWKSWIRETEEEIRRRLIADEVPTAPL
ncbi:MAG: (Fe-S)-binding protein [Desulfosoma sp.]